MQALRVGGYFLKIISGLLWESKNLIITKFPQLDVVDIVDTLVWVANVVKKMIEIIFILWI